MSKDEIIEKYGNVPLSFERYFKYTFTFCGIDTATGAEVIARYGRFHDDIYKLEVTKEHAKTIKGLMPEDVSIRLNGSEIASYSDEY